FTATGSMTVAHNAVATNGTGGLVVLGSGKALIAGGVDTGNVIVSTAEVYDPATAMFTAVGPMADARYSSTATLLPTGLVLVAGGRTPAGDTSNAEVFDSSAATFAPAGTLFAARRELSATILASGRAIVCGGYDDVTASVIGNADLFAQLL